MKGTTEPSVIFSVVIPTYKRHDDLFRCLDALSHHFNIDSSQSYKFGVEVIVSDDACEITLHDVLKDRYPWCRYVEGPTRGPASNRNYGAKQASGEWLAFIDDDCVPQPGWLESFARHTSCCDILEGRTSACGTRTRVDQECPINESGGHLWSCNFAITRDCFFDMNGFNENFPTAAMEDIEFRTRALKLGKSIKFLYDALVYHPWRTRKGFAFSLLYKKSLKQFVQLHPEFKSKYSFSSQLLCALRCIKRSLECAWTTRKWRGLMRQIALDINWSVQTWLAVAC